MIEFEGAKAHAARSRTRSVLMRARWRYTTLVQNLKLHRNERLAGRRSFVKTDSICRSPIINGKSAASKPRARRQIVNKSRHFFSVCLLLLSAASALARENFPNGFPDDQNFFPIGVWLQSPTRAPEYHAIGINTFVGLPQGPTEDQLATLAKYNMFVVAGQNEIALHSINRGIVKGWLHGDEPDNAQPIGLGRYGSCVPASEVVRQTQEMKAHDNTRPVMITFGQGVANEFWKGRGPCTGDESYYAIAAHNVDILSFDIYPVGSQIPQVKGKLEYVARGVARLMKLAADGQKVWAVIETTALDPGLAVSPAQVRSEIWMAIIHGARGIVYFVHEFSPSFREDAIFRYPEVVNQVAKENELIKSLAGVLNSPSLSETIGVQSSAPIDVLAKQVGNTLYVFAVAMTDSASQPRFALRGLDGTEALVVGEERHIAITQGVFKDAFGGYGVHIYEIPVNRTEIGHRG